VSGSMVTSAEPPPPGRHVRKRGFDFAAGDLVLARGTKLNPGRIALALAAGHRTLAASRPPRVAILDTGDELAADPARCETHQIPASNGAMLAAMLAPLGCNIARLGPVRDDRAAIASALAQAEDADLVITSGGASVGDHDLVQATLQDWGAQIAFWKVAIKPGKPMLVATRGHQLILGLPGNPVSCFVTGFFFALPLLRTAMGGHAALPAAVPMVTGEDLPKVGNRREFVRAVGAGNLLHPVGSQDSSALRSLAEAEFLIDRPAHAPALDAGSPVSAYPLHFG
jgi:molybdopterin molybdotransferase